MRALLRRFFVYCLPIFLLPAVFAGLAHAAPVLMISIDGLKPEYVTQADARGMRVPYLRTLVSDGTYAEGVVGVWPTVTYPSHTTLLTGVWPAEHGIYNNLEFDPEQHYSGAWNWYAAQIRVPTLWQAAHQAGLHTASIGWPVSAGATDVDWLIPEYWRSADPSGALNPEDRLLIAALSRPDTLLGELEPAAGTYMMGNDTSIGGDEIKTRYALEILRTRKPAFMTLHLSSLDDAQHAHGPFSAEADADLESIDGMVARLGQQLFANDPSAVLVVVSDHGFMNITHLVNLAIPFIQAGLIEVTVNPASKAAVFHSWKAEPWMGGGMAAIQSHDPADGPLNDDQFARQFRHVHSRHSQPVKSPRLGARHDDSGARFSQGNGTLGLHGFFECFSFMYLFRSSFEAMRSRTIFCCASMGWLASITRNLKSVLIARYCSRIRP